MVLVLFCQFAGTGSSALDSSFTVDAVLDKGLDVKNSLDAGEIWTGKAVTHNKTAGNYDGTITTTLSAWGNQYRDWDGFDYAKSARGELLDPITGDGFLTITDRLYEFQPADDSGNCPFEINVAGAVWTYDDGTAAWTAKDGGVVVCTVKLVNDPVDAKGDKLIWNIHQDYILGTSPATITYTLELKGDSGSLQTGYWYSSGTAEVLFFPSKTNPSYWTKTETTYDSFTMSMNWNNGTGLNSGTITDNILNATISFGKNTSPEFQSAASVPYDKPAANNKYWAHNATVSDNSSPYKGTYWWHLNWVKANTVNNMILRSRI